MLSTETHRGNRESVREGSYGRFLYNLLRYYDPQTGRYLTPDPIGQMTSENLYLYALDNPVNVIDTLGLFGTADFVKHYFGGSQQPVNLGNVGLGTTFEKAPDVQAAVSAFNALLTAEAQQAARAACQGCPPAGPFTLTTAFPFSRNTVTNVTNQPGLFAVGHSTFFRSAQCTVTVNCITRQFTYSCTSDFSINDKFQDPLGIGREVPPGLPYPITHSFSKTQSGAGSFK